jgi:hypothetical protein
VRGSCNTLEASGVTPRLLATRLVLAVRGRAMSDSSDMAVVVLGTRARCAVPSSAVRGRTRAWRLRDTLD